MNETSRMPVTEAEQAEAGDKGASPAKPAGRKPASRKSSVLVDLSRTIAGTLAAHNGYLLCLHAALTWHQLAHVGKEQ